MLKNCDKDDIEREFYVLGLVTVTSTSAFAIRPFWRNSARL